MSRNRCTIGVTTIRQSMIIKKNKRVIKKDLMKTFEKIISKSSKKGTRKKVPPGIYADYGFYCYKMGSKRYAHARKGEEVVSGIRENGQLFNESIQMRKIIFANATALLVIGCSPKIDRLTAYPNLYKEKPLSVIVMPPINRSTRWRPRPFLQYPHHAVG